MNTPARKTLALSVPSIISRKQPPAKFSISDDAHLTIAVGETELTITPEDIRRLDSFMGKFGGVE